MVVEKSDLRSQIFLHLDGITTAPSAYHLYKSGILDYLLDTEKVTLETITSQFNANEGYLNVAFRVLASQGFLNYEIDNFSDTISISLNEKSKYAFTQFVMYKDVVEALQTSNFFTSVQIESAQIQQVAHLFAKFIHNEWITATTNLEEQAIQEQILKHIEGFLIAPLVVSMGMTGMFHKYFMESSFKAEEFHKEPESFKIILDFFAHLGWFTKNNDFYEFTEKGLFFARRATAYGVTVSYLPMFKNLKELLFGNASSQREISLHEEEKHVNREMNVWGSGGAHTTYFKVVDDIIIELFNRPIEQQPKGILDMGCGNGAFLKHIFEIIERYTLRGKMMDDYPLFLVGADYNQAALKVMRANLINADIWAKVIWGDIGNPDLLAKDLKENYRISLSDLLNVRTFLDHNRIWEEPKQITNKISSSTGAFAFRGKRIPNALVEENLLEHLQKWSPYVKKFGLLMIELHTVSPEITAANLGKTAAAAYDATHGFSDQYIVEIDVLHKIAKEAGLQSDKEFFKKYPNTDYATVSINLFKEN